MAAGHELAHWLVVMSLYYTLGQSVTQVLGDTVTLVNKLAEHVVTHEVGVVVRSSVTPAGQLAIQV